MIQTFLLLLLSFSTFAKDCTNFSGYWGEYKTKPVMEPLVVKQKGCKIISLEEEPGIVLNIKIDGERYCLDRDKLFSDTSATCIDARWLSNKNEVLIINVTRMGHVNSNCLSIVDYKFRNNTLTSKHNNYCYKSKRLKKVINNKGVTKTFRYAPLNSKKALEEMRKL